MLLSTGLGGAGGLGGSIGGTAGSSAFSAAESTIVRHMSKNLGKAKKEARRGESKKAWQRLGLRRGQKTRRTPQEPAECVTFTYGQVQEFLIENPCRGLHRAQFPVSYDGGSMSVLTSRVRFRSTWDAVEFKGLIDRHGTGDVRAVLPHPRFTGHHYGSHRERRTVFLAEAEPAEPGVPDEVLDSTAEAATTLSRAARR
ncbi:hypothetical protein [Salinifilum aidingensis]